MHLLNAIIAAPNVTSIQCILCTSVIQPVAVNYKVQYPQSQVTLVNRSGFDVTCYVCIMRTWHFQDDPTKWCYYVFWVISATKLESLMPLSTLKYCGNYSTREN